MEKNIIISLVLIISGVVLFLFFRKKNTVRLNVNKQTGAAGKFNDFSDEAYLTQLGLSQARSAKESGYKHYKRPSYRKYQDKNEEEYCLVDAGFMMMYPDFELLDRPNVMVDWYLWLNQQKDYKGEGRFNCSEKFKNTGHVICSYQDGYVDATFFDQDGNEISTYKIMDKKHEAIVESVSGRYEINFSGEETTVLYEGSGTSFNWGEKSGLITDTPLDNSKLHISAEEVETIHRDKNEKITTFDVLEDQKN